MSDAVQFIRSGNGLRLSYGVSVHNVSKFGVWRRGEVPRKGNRRMADRPGVSATTVLSRLTHPGQEAGRWGFPCIGVSRYCDL
jgi:hypothetical protein